MYCRLLLAIAIWPVIKMLLAIISRVAKSRVCCHCLTISRTVLCQVVIRNHFEATEQNFQRESSKCVTLQASASEILIVYFLYIYILYVDLLLTKKTLQKNERNIFMNLKKRNKSWTRRMNKICGIRCVSIRGIKNVWYPAI